MNDAERPHIDALVLMALADGELTGPVAEAIRSAIEDDPELAIRYADLAETRALLDEGAGAEEAVPPALLEAIRRAATDDKGAPSEAMAVAAKAASAEAIPLASRRKSAVQDVRDDRKRLDPSRRRPEGRRLSLPLAAGLALTAGAIGAFLASWPGEPGPQLVDLARHPAVARVLSTLPSGQQATITDKNAPSGTIMAVATYRMGDGSVCREFRFSPNRSPERLTALACRENGTWHGRVSIAEGDVGARFRAASGAHEVLESAISAMGLEATVSGAEEQSLLEAPAK